MEDSESTDTRTEPDKATLSRFAMATGTILCVYGLAGGTIKTEWTGGLLPVTFSSPEFLLPLLAIVSIYATWRYWYYAILASMTRTKARLYFQSPESIFVFNGTEQALNQGRLNPRSDESGTFAMLIRRLPTPFDAKVATVLSGDGGVSHDEMRAHVARHIEKYFPGLQWESITLRSALAANLNYILWGHVSNLGLHTQVLITLEDLDLYAPILLNVLGLSVIATHAFCGARCIFIN